MGLQEIFKGRQKCYWQEKAEDSAIATTSYLIGCISHAQEGKKKDKKVGQRDWNIMWELKLDEGLFGQEIDSVKDQNLMIGFKDEDNVRFCLQSNQSSWPVTSSLRIG